MSALLKLEDVTRTFVIHRSLFDAKKELHALNGVTLNVERGETFSIVGESGCGKSTLARVALRLIEPTSGRIIFDGVDITSLSPKEQRAMRRRMQIVFQDPQSSLDPRMTVGEIIAEPLRAHGAVARGKGSRDAAAELLEMVGLSGRAASRFPHEFSGGQRQRIGIARAIALRPDIIFCDEPISALDVSIRAQILNLLSSLKRELSLTYVFISHDLSVVRRVSDKVAVMYLGRVVEMGTAREVFETPLHPYTRSLIDAAPIADPRMRGRKRVLLEGELPSPIDLPSGCAFRTRCRDAIPECAERVPAPPATDRHSAACILTRGVKK